MQKISAIIFFAILLSSCKKEKSGGSGGANVQISSTTVGNTMQPNTQTAGYRLDSGIIAAPAAGADLNFNYANVANGTPWTDSLKTPANLTDYPSAKYMTGLNQTIIGQTIALNQYFGLSTTAWTDLGGYINANLNFSMAGYSVSVPKQATKNNPVQTLVNFPIKYNDSINQVCTSAFSMQISGTVSGFPINGPLTVTTTTTVAGKNFAYGHLKLKGYTDSMQVVVQRYSTSVKTDFSSTNFLINSLLGTLLSQIGLSNGQTVTTTEYRFWAKDKGLVLRREGNGMAYVRTGL